MLSLRLAQMLPCGLLGSGWGTLHCSWICRWKDVVIIASFLGISRIKVKGTKNLSITRTRNGNSIKCALKLNSRYLQLVHRVSLSIVTPWACQKHAKILVSCPRRFHTRYEGTLRVVNRDNTQGGVSEATYL